MVRKTSIDTYNIVKNSGLLSKLRLKVYLALYKNGPMGMLETFRYINPGESDGHKLQSYNPRFTELKQMGLIEECGERVCDITNQTVMLLQTTDNVGQKLPKTITKKDKLKEVESLIITLSESLNEAQKVELRVIFKKVRNI